MTRTWFLLAIALFGCKREPRPADPIVGCYSVTDSRDPRYQRGDRVCLLGRGIVVDSTRSMGEEAFEVDWSASGNDFRAVVPPARTGGARVELSVKKVGDGKLDFTVGESWMTVRLEGSAEPTGHEALERLEACRACIDEAVRTGGKDSEPATPIYSLRSCTMFLRATAAPCAALGMKGR